MINEGYHNLTSRERQSKTIGQSNAKSVRQNNRVIGAALRRAAMFLCMIIMGIGEQRQRKLHYGQEMPLKEPL